MPDANTKLLLHFDGVDEAQATYDSSHSEHPITFHNTAQLDTDQKVFGLSSLLLDGDSDWLSVPNHADWNLGADDFTFDFRIRFSGFPSTGDFKAFCYRWGIEHRCFAILLYNLAGSLQFRFYWSVNGTDSTFIASNVLTLAVDTDYHFAFVRDGNTLRFFVDGIAKGTGDLTGITIWNGSADVHIGVTDGHLKFFDGWFDEIRISNTARWTSGFTPPTEAYPGIINMSGLVEAQSALSADTLSIEELVGLIEAQSALTGDIDSILVFSLAGLITAQSSAEGGINVIGSLGGLITAQSSLTGTIFSAEVLAGLITAQSALTGFLEEIGEGVLSGFIAAQSGVSGNLQFCYGSIPPAMHSVLIDPYSGGAWLWLVEIRIPGYSLIRLARNTEDKIYGGTTYLADNFTIGLAPLAGEGSVPRTLLKIAQDADYTLEDKLNATKGGYGGKITIIRAHEDFLTTPIVELEDTVDILTSESDTEHIIIPCGIPNPLIRKIPLWRGSSKICSWASPGLFKGVDCQYAGGDGTCTGKYEDCYAKGNAVHWGGELGLDPTITRV